MAFGILSHTTVPILVVPPRAVKGTVSSAVPEGGVFDSILHPTDFSETAGKAFAAVEAIAGSTAVSRVTLMHVQDKERLTSHLRDRLEEFNRIDGERLDALTGRLKQRGVADVRIDIAYGSPVQEILRISKEGCSLIAMGGQGRGYTSEILLGSVSHNVGRHSGCPVLLVPAVR